VEVHLEVEILDPTQCGGEGWRSAPELSPSGQAVRAEEAAAISLHPRQRASQAASAAVRTQDGCVRWGGTGRERGGILDIFSGWAHMSRPANGRNQTEDGWNGLEGKKKSVMTHRSALTF
jgi:hypothetical protein